MFALTTERRRARVLRVKLAGNADESAMEPLAAMFEDALRERRDVMVLLNECEWMEPVAVNALTTGRERLRSAGLEVLPLGARGQVWHVLSPTLARWADEDEARPPDEDEVTTREHPPIDPDQPRRAVAGCGATGGRIRPLAGRVTPPRRSA